MSKIGFYIEQIEALVALASIVIIFFVKGLNLTSFKNIYFDFSNRKYKTEYVLAMIKISGKWKELPKLEYISVFDVGDTYLIKLWYVKNKHFILFDDYYDREEALKVAKIIADKIDLKVLDATERNKKNTWIN